MASTEELNHKVNIYKDWVIGLMIGCLSIGVILYFNIRESMALDRELIKAKAVVDSFKTEDRDLAIMQKTLLTTYYSSLSKYEAKYYSYIFRDFAKKYKTDWCIYPAKICIESNFNPGLISKRGARGICQLMEGTAKEQAGKLGIKYVKGITEWRLLDNIIMGCNYLSEGIRDSGLDYGLRRYNSGHRNMSKEVTDYVDTVMIEYKKVGYVYNSIKEERN